MKIKVKPITIRDVVDGYVDDNEGGVVGFGGSLNIRPKFQREFVYDDKMRAQVMDTVLKGYPLNVMYWALNDDGTYEVIDGQQRTISFSQYVAGEYSINIDGHPMAFHNLKQEQKDSILDYKLMVYVCEGSEKQKLDWFEVINIAGLKLTDQELRNAVYTGPWLTHAKSIFSKSNGAAYGLSGRYVKGAPNRQEILETALRWISGGKDRIGIYMSDHQHDDDATELWDYYRRVIEWVKRIFTQYRSEMKGIEWGPLYDKFKDGTFDPVEIEEKSSRLMQDDDVTNKRGIYTYLLSGDVSALNIRDFDPAQRRAAYERQGGLCASGAKCLTPENTEGKHRFDLTEMDADHITPWSQGGKTSADNCQMLCRRCNRTKGAK